MDGDILRADARRCGNDQQLTDLHGAQELFSQDNNSCASEGPQVGVFSAT